MCGLTRPGVNAASTRCAKCLAADGHQRKVMIQFLFDEGFWDAEKLTWDAAIARWNDNLNPGKSAFWKNSELWALMSRFGRHHLFLAMADDLGYECAAGPRKSAASCCWSA